MRARIGLALVIFVAHGCQGHGSPSEGDAAELPEACLPVPTPMDWSYPIGPYGDQVGSRLEEFTLEDCEGTPVAFGDILSEAELVLVSVGAGWCQPCIEESATLEAKVHAPLCARGLRVIQVLFQDDESRPATKLFCREWRERFGLRFPVLVDPLFTMQRYFQAAQTPLNLLVDRSGIIRYRATGTAPADLPERISELLPP
ncbi:MAG: TlpA family protein disulfide reductase [Deltaproteobacteria bacterium]|nr:TlpA family protein disulfide reductase [Deltaproteobacteria bacterium]